MLFQFWSCEIRPRVTNICKAGGMRAVHCDQMLVSSSVQLQLPLSNHCIQDTHLQSPAQLFSYLHLLSCLILHLPMLSSFSHCLSQMQKGDFQRHRRQTVPGNQQQILKSFTKSESEFFRYQAPLKFFAIQHRKLAFLNHFCLLWVILK